MKYAVIMYIHTDNIGDDIQTYAALKYLPKVDYVIDREDLSNFKSNDKIKAILNGWFLYNNVNWPPKSNIDVLPISMHITTDYFKNNYEKELFEYRTKKYFSNFETIGCRDIATSKYLSSLKIKNYISNCLTLTIDKFNIKKPKNDYICVVDLPQDIENKVEEMCNIEIKKMTHDYRGKNLDGMTFKDRMKQVEEFLKIYQNAKCVVTTRYHVAMPCIALGTPVILIPSKFEPNRYEGLMNIISVISREEFLNSSFKYDFNNPIKNKSIENIRNNLENICRKFILSDYKQNSYVKENIESLYEKLLKDYTYIKDEINNRERVNYYNKLDMDSYIRYNYKEDSNEDSDN